MKENNDDWREVRQLVLATGLTHAQIAKELDCSLRTVCGLGSPARRYGVSKLTKDALRRLAKK